MLFDLMHDFRPDDRMPPKCKFLALFLFLAVTQTPMVFGAEEDTFRVFIFAGQSNMVGSDSKVKDIANFPPFLGLEQPQSDVRFAYLLGRENKTKSDGWVDLQAVNNIVGPELSFARKVTGSIKAPIAIIKCAAGGTHLGGDWNPDEPIGFRMYPLALNFIRSSLAELDELGVSYRIEGFMWHQGENDMSFHPYRKEAAKRLQSIIGQSRKDLDRPTLKWYLSQQPPTDDKRVNVLDVTTDIEKIAAADQQLIHIKVFNLPAQEKKLVINTQGIVRLGEVIANEWLEDP